MDQQRPFKSAVDTQDYVDLLRWSMQRKWAERRGGRVGMGLLVGACAGIT